MSNGYFFYRLYFYFTQFKYLNKNLFKYEKLTYLGLTQKFRNVRKWGHHELTILYLSKSKLQQIFCIFSILWGPPLMNSHCGFNNIHPAVTIIQSMEYFRPLNIILYCYWWSKQVTEGVQWNLAVFNGDIPMYECN